MSNDGHKVVKPEDVTDEKLVPGELRAFRSEMRDKLDGIARALQSLVRIEARMDVVIDRQNVLEQRLDDHDKRLAAVEAAQKPRRKTARKKKP